MRTLREPHQRFAVPWPKPTISCCQIIGKPSLFEEESVLGQIALNNCYTYIIWYNSQLLLDLISWMCFKKAGKRAKLEIIMAV